VELDSGENLNPPLPVSPVTTPIVFSVTLITTFVKNVRKDGSCTTIDVFLLALLAILKVPRVSVKNVTTGNVKSAPQMILKSVKNAEMVTFFMIINVSILALPELSKIN
jgi:hypothetical protein